jgi:hypothetical protein
MPLILPLSLNQQAGQEKFRSITRSCTFPSFLSANAHGQVPLSRGVTLAAVDKVG